MTKLADGTIITSAFRGKPSESQHGFDHVKKSTTLKIGTIISTRYVDSSDGLQKSQEVNEDDDSGTPYETAYDVRVDDHNARPVIYNGCRALKPWFGANNFFDMTHESADISATYSQDLVFNVAAQSLTGARCVILCVEGDPTSGVILGFLQHPARPSQITEDMGLHLAFEFNGIGVTIDKDGAFHLEGNGPYIDPVGPPVGPVPDSEIRSDPLIGPFTIDLDSDMIFTVADNTGQMFSIDRTAGTIDITNGTEEILITASLAGQGTIAITVGGEMTIDAGSGTYSYDESLDVTAPSTSFTADESFSIDCGSGSISTKEDFSVTATTGISLSSKTDFSIDASTGIDISSDTDFSLSANAGISMETDASFEVKALTLSLTAGASELLDVINELITAIGNLTALSPVGPCAPLTGAPTWAMVELQLTKLQLMMG